MERQILDAEADAMTNHPRIKSNSRKPLKWGFFIPKFDLSESCQKKTGFFEFFYFWGTHKTLVNIGGRGGIRTHGSLATTSDFESGAFNHSATLPERAYLFLTNTDREQAHSSRGQTRSKLQTTRHASRRLLLAGFARMFDSLSGFPRQNLLWSMIVVAVPRRSPQKICFP
jgi:hypothetical protein